MDTISIVLPAYNESENIASVINRIYTSLGSEIEILVVNDASTDETAQIASQSGARVITNPYNMGNGAAVKRGIRAASGDIIVLMDADGQHPPEAIPQLLNDLEHFDMVISSRINCRQPWLRKLANMLYNLLASYVSGMVIKDLTSGFRIFRRDQAMKFLYLLPNTFSYPTTLTLSFIKAAYPVKFTAVDITPRTKGKSKINIFSDGMRFLIIIMRIAVFLSPLKVFTPVSIFSFLLGLGYYIYTYVAFNRFTNMSLLLFTTSVIIFMLGLISEQIASLRMDKIDNPP